MKTITQNKINELEALAKKSLIKALEENFNIILASVETKTEFQARLLDASRQQFKQVKKLDKKQLEQISKTEIIYMLKLFTGKAYLKYYRVYFEKETLERVL